LPSISPTLELIQEVEGGGLNQPSVGITRRFAGGKTTESKVIEANGENTLVTPATGKALTLYWIALVTPEANAAEVLAEIKLGSLVPYTWYLGKPGAFMHWEPVIGALNAKLTVKLSAAQKVAASYTYSEG
jgi:hypothetical protein